MKDWRADYERHVSLGFSVGNIKGFSDQERTLYITHGYGHMLPIRAREVYVRDERCFGLNWVEQKGLPQPAEHVIDTARLSAGAEGVPSTVLAEYLDRHIDSGFISFVDEYFEGTPFITQILKTAYRYWTREKTPIIRKALKLVVAYSLTQHITLIASLPGDEILIGKVEDEDSKWKGHTVAPVMINFQVKCAMADMWRDLQKDVLEELSSLYSSVYTKDKLKHWPTIFMLATILLAVWETMQFDCRYRVPVNLQSDVLLYSQLTLLGRCRCRKVLQRHGNHPCWSHCRPFLRHISKASRVWGVGFQETFATFGWKCCGL